MKTAFRLFAAALVLYCAGCASDNQSQQNPNASSIPWDRPQSWENQGMLGGFTQPEGSTGH